MSIIEVDNSKLPYQIWGFIGRWVQLSTARTTQSSRVWNLGKFTVVGILSFNPYNELARENA